MSHRSDKGRPRRLLSVTSRLTSAGRARRRFNCGKQEEWDERAANAVALLLATRHIWARSVDPPFSIADFGAGNERLRTELDSTLGTECDYHPFDLYPQQPSTRRLDIAAGLPDENFDIGICLGLLEYLPSIADLAGNLHAHCRYALVSYVTADGSGAMDLQQRREHNWTTHATRSELEGDFAAAGFAASGTTTAEGGVTTIWLWGRQ